MLATEQEGTPVVVQERGRVETTVSVLAVTTSQKKITEVPTKASRQKPESLGFP